VNNGKAFQRDSLSKPSPHAQQDRGQRTAAAAAQRLTIQKHMASFVEFSTAISDYLEYEIPSFEHNELAAANLGGIVPVNTELCAKCGKKETWVGSKFCITCDFPAAYLAEGEQLAGREIARLIGAERVA